MDFICNVSGALSSEKVFNLKISVSAQELSNTDSRNQFYDAIFEFVQNSLLVEIPDLGLAERLNDE